MSSLAILQSLKESIVTANAKTAYGEPIAAQGKTVIPVAKTVYAYGGALAVLAIPELAEKEAVAEEMQERSLLESWKSATSRLALCRSPTAGNWQAHSDDEVLRPADANANTVKALEQQGLIYPGKGRDPLTMVWHLSFKEPRPKKKKRR